MKVHSAPPGKKLNPYPVALIMDESGWTYMVTGPKTYIRTPDRTATYEIPYQDITHNSPPIGYCPPPSENLIVAYAKGHIVPLLHKAG